MRGFKALRRGNCRVAESTAIRLSACKAATTPAGTSDLMAIQDLSGTEQYPHGLNRLSPESTSMRSTISRLGHVSLAEFQPSNFVKPQSVYYHLDGEKRRWDVVEAHDSIAIILYHKSLDSMLLVRQFRPALYAKCMRDGEASGAHGDIPLAHAFACELCAGIVDKDKTLEEIAKEEVLEECGYDISLSNITSITSFAASIGVQGSTQNLFFAEVEDSMKAGGGGGLQADGERIELLALPLEKVEAFVMDSSVPKTSGAMFGLIWGKQMVMSR